jgi:hypothetical protein
MSEVQETTVMKVARALYELENDQPYVLSWADASKSESMLEYYVEQAECALLASGLPAAIEARDKALERVKALEAALENYFQAFDHGGTLLQTADKLCELRDVFRWGHP